MTGKQRMVSALSLRQPDDWVPRWELSFQAWDQVSGRHVVLGREFESLTPAEQDRALHENADIMLSVCRELEFSGLTPPGGYWEVSPGQPAYSWLPGEARWRQMEILQKLNDDELLLTPTTGGVMAMPSAHNYVEFSYQLFDDPEKIDEKARKVYRQGVECVKRMRDCGITCVKTSSDLADNHGPFFNPEQMERFILPYLRDWSEFAHRQGMLTIIHTDGNVQPILESIADSGVDALQAIDPVAGMDIGAVKDQVGDRICLCGNVDCGLLLTGPAEQVYEQTRQVLTRCKSGGGLVLGASNAVVRQTPIENYRALIEAWKDHGRYE